MKTLFINQVKLTRDACILKIYLQGQGPGHYHTLKFESFEKCMIAQQKLVTGRKKNSREGLSN